MSVRLLPLAALATILAGCAPRPAPVEKPKPDITAEAWYGETAGQLAAMNRDAEALFQAGKFDEAAAVITKAQPLESRLLEAAHPTLPAMTAASGLDDLYGRMLLRNGRYGFARGVFQKNVIRWKTWKPRTLETERQLKLALAAVAECDRHLSE